MSKTVEYVEDEVGTEIFRVTHEASGITTPTMWQAVVEQVTGWDPDDALRSVEWEPYASVIIKWDSCSHLTFGDGDQMHLCGVQYFKQHVMLMEWLYRKAFEMMGRDPLPDEVWR